MGFETFRVELCGGTATYTQAEEAVRRYEHARPDHDSIASRGSAYYTIEDGSHVIEVEVAASPVRVSCRFTLCHPPDIDAEFMGLVRDMQTRLGMVVRICDDVRPEHARCFPPAQFPEFSGIVSDYIAARRAEWIANFGPETLSATTPEVYEKIILPKCVPVAS